MDFFGGFWTEAGGSEAGGADSGGAEAGGAEAGGAESGGAEAGGAEIKSSMASDYSRGMIWAHLQNFLNFFWFFQKKSKSYIMFMSSCLDLEVIQISQFSGFFLQIIIYLFDANFTQFLPNFYPHFDTGIQINNR